MSGKRSKYLLIATSVLILIGAGTILLSKRSPTVQSANTDLSGKPRLLTSFTQNGVQVEVSLEKDATGQTSVAATYRPLNAGYHLYSKDLPRTGIDGVGRPSLLEISGNGVQSTGALLESVPTIKLNATWSKEPVPVYPEGPVTLRLPIKFLEDSVSPIVAKLSLTYETCSATTCFPPVVGKTIPVTLQEPNQ